MDKIYSVIGIIAIFVLTWFLSEKKKEFPLRIVLWGLAIQLSLGFLVLKLPWGVAAFKWLGDRVAEFLAFSMKGAEFLFGNITLSEHSNVFGFQFAIIVTSTIIFFSSFVAILYYYGIMQKVVYAFAWVMQKTMRTSGIESLSASSNIFLGQTEAPLLIRHYLPSTTRSEMNAIMVGGFATIAGGVLAAYVTMGIDPRFLITASIISAPGGLMLSKIVLPPEGNIKTLNQLHNLNIPKPNNVLLAITNGASDGIMLSVNIMAMLIAFISLIALLDAGLGVMHNWLAGMGFMAFPSSIKVLLGYLFLPFAWLCGIPSGESLTFSSLVGTKIAVNEFLAYTDLSKLIASGAISPRTASIATFALCGFANFSSIAIQIGGLGALVPEKKTEISRLGFRAMIIGALTNLMTAMIASLML